MKGIIAYLQDADGNERELDVTEPDPKDGTYCVHMDDQEQAWIRIVSVPTNREEFIGRVLELTKEYADEAEHQDGPGYWNNFESSDQAATDFAQYVLSKEQYKGDLFHK